MGLLWYIQDVSCSGHRAGIPDTSLTALVKACNQLTNRGFSTAGDARQKLFFAHFEPIAEALDAVLRSVVVKHHFFAG